MLYKTDCTLTMEMTSIMHCALGTIKKIVSSVLDSRLDTNALMLDTVCQTNAPVIWDSLEQPVKTPVIDLNSKFSRHFFLMMLSVSAYFLAIPAKDLVLVGRGDSDPLETQSETYDTESNQV